MRGFMAADSRQARRGFHGRVVWLLLFAVTVSGCGTQFIYNRLEWISATYIGNQVSLDDAQSAQLRGALREFFAWHRSRELPRYADFLERLARDARSPLTAAQIDAARITVEGFVRDATLKSAPEASRWLASLNASQLDEFFANLGDDDGELRDEYCGDPATVLRRREREVIKSLEKWTGRMLREQRDLVRARLATIEPTGCAWVEARVRSRGEFRALIDQQRSSGDFATRVGRFLSQPEERWAPQYREAYERNRTVIVTMLADLHAAMGDEQRERVVVKLENYARDCRELSASPEREAASQKTAARSLPIAPPAS
jgi:hypothetical protein